MIQFAEFVNKHQNETALVIGLGESTNLIRDMDLSHLVTIGVNDLDRVLTPNYLLVLDDKKVFAPERAAIIANTKAQYLFTHVTDWDVTKKAVRLKLGRKGPPKNLDNYGTLDISCNSPYVAALLAYQMGCRKIGMIGLDFTDNHCYAKDGKHMLVRANRVAEIEKDFAALLAAFVQRGCELYNLSPISILKAIPKADLETFILQ